MVMKQIHPNRLNGVTLTDRLMSTDPPLVVRVPSSSLLMTSRKPEAYIHNLGFNLLVAAICKVKSNLSRKDFNNVTKGKKL